VLREDRPIRHAVQTDRTSSSKLPITVTVVAEAVSGIPTKDSVGSMRGVISVRDRYAAAGPVMRREMREKACCSPTGDGSDDCSSQPNSQLPGVYWRAKVMRVVCVWWVCVCDG
jgi:hypothetical protein